jgi:prepilin-type N-terminal cleavage/methylation domain-containing protein
MALLIETALTAAMNSADIAEPNGHEGGFSLIEVLVALVLLSVIAGLMTGFMGQFRILKRVQSENAAQLEVEALAGFLGESISGAMPLHLIDQNPGAAFSAGRRARSCSLHRFDIQGHGRASIARDIV